MIPRIAVAACLLAASAAAQSPVTIAVNPRNPGPAIAAGFSGISFETSNLLAQRGGEHLFSSANRELASLFRVLGIRSLRMGGSTADMPKYAVPGEADSTSSSGSLRQSAAVMLAAPNHDAAAREGITLGGASIEGAEWDGKWMPLVPGAGGKLIILVPGISAAVMRLTL